MGILISLIMIIISQCMYILNPITLYTLIIYNFICQVYLNKAEKFKKKLHHMAHSHRLSILHMVKYVCNLLSQFVPPSFLHCVHKSVLFVSPSLPWKQFISTIILDSIYMLVLTFANIDGREGTARTGHGTTD